MQAAAANSATAGMEAATAKKMMAEFRAAITAQVATLQERLGVDAAELTKVTFLYSSSALKSNRCCRVHMVVLHHGGVTLAANDRVLWQGVCG